MHTHEKFDFLDFDIYSRRISFFYKNKEKFGSTFGFILTVLYTVLSLIIFLVYFVKTLKREEVRVSDSTVYPTEIPSIEINNDLFYISFGLENSNTLTKYIDESIYCPEVLYIEKIKENGEFILKSEKILNIERCDIKNFGEEHKHLLENDIINNSYCLKDINDTLKGGFKFNEMSYIKINIFPCINNTNNNNHCKPQNIIDQYLKSSYFSILLKDIGFNLFNYSVPIVPIFQYFRAALDKHIFKEYMIYFGVVEISTDIGLFTNEYKEEKYLKYMRDLHSFFFIDNEKFHLDNGIFSAQIMLEDYIYTQKRSFTKMSEVFSSTGGYMQVISTILALIALLTKKFSLEQKLLNILFNFNIKQKKIILCIEYGKKLDFKTSEKNLGNNFFLYEPKKSIISKKSRRDSFIILNTTNNKLNNNITTIKRSVTMQNPNLTGMKELSYKSNSIISKEGSSILIKKLSKEKEKEDPNINRSKVNMIYKGDDLKINELFQIKKSKKKKSTFNILEDLKSLDKGGRTNINFSIFDYYCLRKINKNKNAEIELFNFGINFFKNQMDIINFFNIIILTQVMLTKQSDKKENYLNRTIELYMKRKE